MNDTTLTPELAEIGSALSTAIRRDRARSVRRRRSARAALISVGAVSALSGTALGAGQALGVIDLGGGVSAEGVNTIPGAPAGAPGSELPYKYKLRLPPTGDPAVDGAGEPYVMSDKPLEPGKMNVQRGRADGRTAALLEKLRTHTEDAHRLAGTSRHPRRSK